MPEIKNQFNNCDFSDTAFKYEGKVKIKRFLGSRPIFPEVFIARMDTLREIRQNLKNPKHNCLLLVNGEGGIGKTTLASVYYHHYSQKYQHLIWIVAEQGIKNALLGLALPLALKFEDNSPEEQRLKNVLDTLANLKTPSLLVIDNADDLADLEAVYPALRRYPHLHILLTSRLTEFQHINHIAVNVLNPDDAKTLFIKHYAEHQASENDLLEQILEAVGYNTLVIELLAKNLAKLNKIKTKYSLQTLLEDLQKRGLLSLSKSRNISTDYKTFSNAGASEVIEAMYDISTLSEEEKALLSVFAALPAINIPFDDIEELLATSNEMQLDDIALALAQKGWIDYDKEQKSFKCTMLVAEVTRKKNKQNLAQNCEVLIYNLADKLLYHTGGAGLRNTTYQKAIIYVQYGEALCNLSELRSQNLSILMERIGSFYQSTGNIDKALEFYLERSRLGKELYQGDASNVNFKNGLAISYSKLGETYAALGKLDKALEFYSEDLKLTKELYQGDASNVNFKNGLAISYYQLGVFFIQKMDKPQESKKYFEQARVLWAKLSRDFPAYVEFGRNLEAVNGILNAI